MATSAHSQLSYQNPRLCHYCKSAIISSPQLLQTFATEMTPSLTNESQILDSWNPEPLVPVIDEVSHGFNLKPHIVSSKPGLKIVVDGEKCLNFVTPNYLGFADDERLELASKQALAKYGVGSCGPRAFYGTMDVHLKLEDQLAQFLQVEEAILYSFGFSTIASAIPAYAKADDYVFADECCNFAIQQGVHVSRAKFYLFRHNDTVHLRQLIKQVGADNLLKKRSFIIVEGIYDRTGNICPLEELVEIKKEYKIRLFIDESHSFGVLGSEGKGVTQHFNVDTKDIDLIMASIENGFCSYGGFCAGSSFVVDHQRLAGSGYIFSASLPPLQVLAALESLKIIREDPGIVINSQEAFKRAHTRLENLKHFNLISNELSPIKHLILKKHSEKNRYKLCDDFNRGLKEIRFGKGISSGGIESEKGEESSPEGLTVEDLSEYRQEFELLLKFCESVLKSQHVAISVARYIEDEEMTLPIPSIKLMIPACVTAQHLDLLRCSLDSYSSGSP